MVGVDETSKREVAAASSAGVARTSNCFSKMMMMAAGAESPSVATQSAKTDILQKIGQGGNNHQTNLELAELHEEDLSEDGKEEKPENNVETRRSETTTPAHQQLAATAAASALEVS